MSESETLSKLKLKGGPFITSSGSKATISGEVMTVLQTITVCLGINGPLSFTSSRIIPSIPVHVLPSRKSDIKIQFLKNCIELSLGNFTLKKMFFNIY